MNNIKSVDRIVSAKDYGGSMTGYLRSQQRNYLKSGRAVNIIGLDGAPRGEPVKARIWQSQWVADCECNTTMFVDPDEPIFFCFGCANRLNGERIRPVEFPPRAERERIEELLLERPVIDVAGLTDLERVGLQKPLLFVDVEVEEEIGMEEFAHALMQGIPVDSLPKKTKRVQTLPLTRSWRPGESPADLEAQQRSAIEAWKKELSNGVR